MYQATNTDERIDALETDTQQAVDAVMKALAMAYAIHRLYDGSITEKIGQFKSAKAGQALMFYYAAIEIGMPFTDNALKGGGLVLKQLYDAHGKAQVAKLAAIVGEADAEAASGILAKLLATLGTMVDMAGQHLGPIAEAGVGFLPRAVDVGDKAAGVLATGADLLSVYRYLGARLVAEACIGKALTDAPAEQAETALSNPANVEIQYTRSKDDLPDAPAKKRGCFGFFVAILAVMGSAGTGLLGWLL
jgi:hypothetical protein